MADTVVDTDTAEIADEVSKSELITPLGAVLTYETDGYGGAGGQQVGADGRGEYAVIFTGNPEDAETAARDYLNKLRTSGNRIRTFTIVANYEGYYGLPIAIVNSP